MTLGELKRALDAIGATDDDTIEVFDRKMFDELMDLSVEMLEDEGSSETLMEYVKRVDLLADRFWVADRSPAAVGFDGTEMLLRPPVAVRDDHGIVHVYYTSQVTTERRSW